MRTKAEVLAFTTFPKAHWRKIWSTDPLERVNKEIKRSTGWWGSSPSRRRGQTRRRRADRHPRRMGRQRPPLPLRGVHGAARPPAWILKDTSPSRAATWAPRISRSPPPPRGSVVRCRPRPRGGPWPTPVDALLLESHALAEDVAHQVGVQVMLSARRVGVATTSPDGPPTPSDPDERAASRDPSGRTPSGAATRAGGRGWRSHAYRCLPSTGP